jgi:hypothetical protein
LVAQNHRESQEESDMKSTTNAKTQRQHSGSKPDKVENKQAHGGPRVKTGLRAGVMKSRHETAKNTISN